MSDDATPPPLSSLADQLAAIRPDAYAHAAALDAEVNDTDKVYRNVATGAAVKVRCLRLKPPPRAGFGIIVVEVSGAMCDPKTGRALPHAEGHQIAPPQRHTFMSDQPADLAIQLERVRRDVAAATERAALMEQQAAEGLPR